MWLRSLASLAGFPLSSENGSFLSPIIGLTRTGDLDILRTPQTEQRWAIDGLCPTASRDTPLPLYMEVRFDVTGFARPHDECARG